MRIAVPDNAAGKAVQCPGCKFVFTAPHTPQKSKAPPAAPKPAATPLAPFPTQKPAAATPKKSARPLPAPALVQRPASPRRSGPSNPVQWLLFMLLYLGLVGGGGVLAWHVLSRTKDPQAPIVVQVSDKKGEDSKPADKTNDFKKKESSANDKKGGAPQPEVQKKPSNDEKLPAKETVKKNDTTKQGKIDKEVKIDESKKEPPKEEAPKDELKKLPSGWVEVVSGAGRFRIHLPDTPLLQEFEEKHGEIAGPEYVVKHPKDDIVFRAAAFQTTEIHLDPTSYARSFFLHYVGHQRFTTKAEQAIEFRKRKGREFEYVEAEQEGKRIVSGRYFRLHDVPKGARYFCLIATGADARLEHPDIKSFLESFDVLDGPVHISRKKTLRVHPDNEKPHHILPGTSAARAVGFSQDGKLLMAGWWDGVIKVMDTDNFADKFSFPPEKEKRLAGATLSADRKTVAKVYGRETIDLLDLESGKVETLTDEAMVFKFVGFRRVRFSPDGKWLVSSAQPGARIWDLGAKKPGELFLFDIQAIAISPDSKHLALGRDLANRLVLVDLPTGKASADLYGVEGDTFAVSGPGPGSLAVSPDGKQLIAGWSWLRLRTWNLEDKKQLSPIRLQGPSSLLGPMAYSGEVLAVCTGGGYVQLWHLEKQKWLATLRAGKEFGTLWDLALCPDAKKLAVTRGNDIYVWELDRLVLEK
ncbi:MAG: hypothetical protein L0Y70_21070 [Gemmataceae bacterium]|nr:hypothetical protein [Gemmataceae bacterium]